MIFNALVRLDDFVVDRVFQPVADRVNQYALAEFFFTGAVVFYLPDAWHRRSWIMGPLIVLGWSTWILKARALGNRPARNAIPIERVTGAVARPGLITMQFVGATGIWFDHSIWRLVGETSWWLGIIGLYLVACRPHPPRPAPRVREVIA